MAKAQFSYALHLTLATLLSAAAFAGCAALAPNAPPEHVTLALPEPAAHPLELSAPSQLSVQPRPEPVEGPTPAPPGLIARLNWNDEFGERTIVFDTVSGTVKLRQVGSGSLMLKFGETVVHVNPWSGAGEYESLPKADQIWITDPSPEHLDLHAIRAVSTESTQLIVDPQSAKLLRGLLGYTQLQSQVQIKVDNLEVMALPTFWAEMLPDGPRLNTSNSYLASYGGFRVFLAGQAHYIPGFRSIDKVDIALLSVDDLRSLSAKQAAEITLRLSPSALLPYQYGAGDPAALAELLADSGILVLPLNAPEQTGPQPIGVAPDRSLSIAGLYLESEQPDPALMAGLFGAAEQVNPLMLPDLRTLTPSSLYLTHNSYTNTTLLRLTNSISNAGYGPLELWGRVSKDGATHSVAQRIFQADGSYQERLMGEFVFHPDHNHWHLEGFSIYELWSVAKNGTLDQVAATSGKVSYCLRDIHRIPHPHQAPRMGYGSCSFGRQGLSVGWADVYDHYLPGQSIDISGLPDGVYALMSTADPLNLIQESDETNNAVVIYLQIQGQRVSIVDRPSSLDA